MAGQTPRRIGVLGGAFDPPHLAHQALAQAACLQLQLDELRIVPTGWAWHKSRTLSASEHRLEMAQLAFAGICQAVVDSRETQRSGPSYTIDTLREILADTPGSELFLIIGADQAQALTTWKAWNEIVQTATICVAARAYSTGVSGEFDAEKLHPDCFRHINMLSMPLCATDIRAKIAARQDVTAWVCDSVARYIADHQLYQLYQNAPTV